MGFHKPPVKLYKKSGRAKNIVVIIWVCAYRFDIIADNDKVINLWVLRDCLRRSFLSVSKSQASLATLEQSFSSNQSLSELALDSIKKPPPVGEGS